MDQNLPKDSGTPSSAKLAAIYLNDHLTGASSGVELTRRLADAQRGTELGDTVAHLLREITADRSALLRIMHDLGAEPRGGFTALGWAVEKAARLKLNGRLLRRSPLSTLVELETLRLGVLGKHQLWRALARAYADDPRVDAGRLEELQQRAEQQATILERLHQAAAETALTPTGA